MSGLHLFVISKLSWLSWFEIEFLLNFSFETLAVTFSCSALFALLILIQGRVITLGHVWA